MGLDTVELVMAVEEHFHIEVPDAAASKIGTVGELHTFVHDELRRLGRTNLGYTEIYDQLREIICRQLGVHPRKVVLEAHIVKDLGAD